MGVLRTFRSDLFSLGFGWQRSFAFTQGIDRVDDGDDTRFSGVDRVCDSYRVMAALSGLDVALPNWLSSKDMAMRLSASTMGSGGAMPPELRLKA